ncbi:MAG: ATP-binding cassette domain-containing protein [Acidobacteria bacterium]|nr:ATP-binding cassette domain-containing protein [Acidobacteriota bacterium]
MSVPAIRIQNFTKRYGKITAVDNLSIDVPKGSIFGLLGQNGAGTTTTIRTMLNLLQPSEGSIEILGLDSVRESLEVRKRSGYLPEEPTYYAWMTVDEIIGFNAAFYPTWDDDLADKLLDDLGLPRDRKLGSPRVSRGDDRRRRAPANSARRCPGDPRGLSSWHDAVGVGFHAGRHIDSRPVGDIGNPGCTPDSDRGGRQRLCRTELFRRRSRRRAAPADETDGIWRRDLPRRSLARLLVQVWPPRRAPGGLSATSGAPRWLG